MIGIDLLHMSASQKQKCLVFSLILMSRHPFAVLMPIALAFMSSSLVKHRLIAGVSGEMDKKVHMMISTRPQDANIQLLFVTESLFPIFFFLCFNNIETLPAFAIALLADMLSEIEIAIALLFITTPTEYRIRAELEKLAIRHFDHKT
jgi:hypothetical protein